MSDELKTLRARRSALMREYGRRGEKHPLGRMIGGLNPAAQELHRLRGQIARLEEAKRGPRPVLREIEGTRRGYGLKYTVSFNFRDGKIGMDNLGKWYVVVDGEIVAENFATKGKAVDAFERFVGGV